MDFNEEREELLKEVFLMDEKKKCGDFYNRRFFDIVEKVILYLLQGQDAFFGQFMLSIKREIRFDIKVPIATIPKRDGFNMYFNPFFFLNCTKREMAALLKHEIYHIMNLHFEREKQLKNRFSKEAVGVALDISINQYIKDLPGYSRKLESINMEHNLNLAENRSVEEYAEEIYKSIKSRIKKDKFNENGNEEFLLEMDKAHEIWDEIDIDEESINSLTKKTAISAYNKNTPEGLEKIILSYDEKPEISWELVLKNAIPAMKSGYKKTIVRRNRRQPERFDLRGTLPKNEAEVVVAIDISASMKDDEMKKILIEILSITHASKNKVTVIECDNEIRKVYKLRSEKDIQKRCRENGSTLFSPVFKYIRDKNMKNCILVYFTDGVGEKELEIKPFNKKTLWVICGDDELSLKESYGEVKRIHREKYEKLEGNIGLQMVNEVIHDWAR
ncbi:MAG: VWA-like domain-containing protein [Clostridium sp.]|uniref:vWA domain-containing protein n=1 Tax=Clostridium TaxID=1485 RepID=UPI0012B93E32|nr:MULTISPECIES: VWA-like domain-containing protein [Clostridium]MDU2894779.1 VWA-like domain-containing protein [Clostridium sp.]MDU3007290.1 VWA-like domain-containing protein [Clostridium sp.]MDU3037178.1 VWA-like domain-containing protein [Clostridium sp.]MDU3051669.1 VWA-like domain-containing protein [Clostridium sp.]